MSEFKQGIKDSIPIAAGYFSVSFSFGILALSGGLSVFQAVLTSFTNLTSAGQFAGLKIMLAGGTILEMILTQLIINLRYALMSLSLSQKLAPDVKIWQRLIMAFGNTDEIFAVAVSHGKELTLRYMVGLELLPLLGWSAGTAAGALACDLLPVSLSSALSVALYGMFIAIVVHVAEKSRPVMIVTLIALLMSSVLYYVPAFSKVSAGIAIIICTVGASALGAAFFPVKEEIVEEDKVAETQKLQTESENETKWEGEMQE